MSPGSGCRSSGTTTARNDHQPGGHDCSESQHPSTAAPAGRIGALFSEAMRVLALRPLGLLLERTERSVGPMLNATLTQSEASCSTQLYHMLVMLWKGTVLTRVVNAGAQEGLEAWRCLVLHHEPTSLTRSAGLLQELLNFSFEGETAARMAQFDRDIDRYEKASGETFPENIRNGVALRMLLGGPLKQHRVLNSAQLTTRVTLNRQCQTPASCSQLDNSTDGSVGVWRQRGRLLPERQVAWQRQSQGKGRGQTQGQCSDDALPDLWQGWSLEERLLVQHP